MLKKVLHGRKTTVAVLAVWWSGAWADVAGPRELLVLPGIVIPLDQDCIEVHVELLNLDERNLLMADYFADVEQDKSGEFQEIRSVFGHLSSLAEGVGADQVSVFKWGAGNEHPVCDFVRTKDRDWAEHNCRLDEMAQEALMRRPRICDQRFDPDEQVR